MGHAGHHEEAGEVLGARGVVLQLPVPVAQIVGREDGVGDALEDDHLAAACLEGGQVGGHGVVEGAGLQGERQDGVEVHLEGVEFGLVGRHEVVRQRHGAQHDVAGVGGGSLGVTQFPAAPVAAVDAGIPRPAGVEGLTLAGACAAKDGFQQSHLLLADVLFHHPGLEVAAFPGVDQAVLQAVQGVAAFQHAGHHGIQVLLGEGVGKDALALFIDGGGLQELLVVPRLGDGCAREPEARVAGHHAVELQRVAHGGHHGLASAVGAAHEVAALRGAVVHGLDELAGGGHHLAGGGVGQVQPGLLVLAEEGVTALVAAVHAHHGIAAQQRRLGRAAASGDAAQGVGHEAIGAAAALEQELVVPAGRQAQLELGAVVATISARAGFDLAAHHAVLFGLQRLARGAGEGRVGVLGQTAALHPLHALDDHIGQFHLLQVAAAALGVGGIVGGLGGSLGAGGPEQAADRKTAGKQRQQGRKAVQFHGMGSERGPKGSIGGGGHPAWAFRPDLPGECQRQQTILTNWPAGRPGEKAARERRPVRDLRQAPGRIQPAL